MVLVTPPLTVTNTCGFSRRLRNQAGCVFSPPFDATITNIPNSRWGDVNMTDRRVPDLRPVVVNRSTGMWPTVHPSLPPLSFSKTRCALFIVLKNPSLGIN